MNKDSKIQRIVWTGLFTALVAVGTMIRLPIPMANGYVNAGDAMVIVSAFLLTPFWGAFAAGVGAAITDAMYGYFIYVPATLVIKACMALAAGAILRTFKDKKPKTGAVLGSVCAAVILVGGYFAYECLIYGFAGALADVIPNTIQGVFGAAAGTVLFYALSRIPYVREHF
ncbi:MAG: ECF transporter S component [Oscillospiraceae bacterium]|jgi:uncharacterized membrane protein